VHGFLIGLLIVFVIAYAFGRAFGWIGCELIDLYHRKRSRPRDPLASRPDPYEGPARPLDRSRRW
jgi:hypothetical protein